MSRKLFGHGRFHRAVRSSSGTAYVPPAYVDNTPPTAPTNFAATATTVNSISTSWTASGDLIDVTGYRVWKDSGGVIAAVTSPDDLTSAQRAATLVYNLPIQTAYTFTSLAPDTEYNLYVTAYNASGQDSNFSDVLTVSTAAAAGDTTAPTITTFIFGDPAVNETVAPLIQWESSDTETGVAKWILAAVEDTGSGTSNPWAAETGSVPDLDNPTPPGTGWQTSKPTGYDVGTAGDWDIYGAVQDGAGNVSVVSSDSVTASSDANSPFYATYDAEQSGYYASSGITASGGSSNPTAPPINVRWTQVGDNNATVEWDSPAASLLGYTYFTLEVKEGAGDYAEVSATISTSDRAYSVEGLTANTAIYARMTSLPGPSAYSNVASSTTTNPPPLLLPTPTNMDVDSYTYNTITFSGTPPTQTDAVYYEVWNEYGGGHTLVTTVPVKTNGVINSSWTIGVSASTYYYLRLLAVATDGTKGSSYSNYMTQIQTSAAPAGGAIIKETFDGYYVGEAIKPGTANYGLDLNGINWNDSINAYVYDVERAKTISGASGMYAISNPAISPGDVPSRPGDAVNGMLAFFQGTGVRAEQRFILPSTHADIWLQFDFFVPSNYSENTTDSGWGRKHLAINASNTNPQLGPQLIIGTANVSGQTGDTGLDSLMANTIYWNAPTRSSQNFGSGSSNLVVDVSVDNGYWQRHTCHLQLPTGQNTSDGNIDYWSKKHTGVVQHLASLHNFSFYDMTGHNYIQSGYFIGTATSLYPEPTTLFVTNIIFSESQSDIDQTAIN